MITVADAPIKQPMFIDPPTNSKMHPVWSMFFEMLARAAQGKDVSGVNASKLEGHPWADVPASPLIFDYTVTGSAATSVTTNGVVTLDGLAHGGYEFEFIIQENGVGSQIRVFFEGETYANRTNYKTQYIYSGGAAPSGGSVDDTWVMVHGSFTNGNWTKWVGTLTVDPNGRVSLTGYKNEDMRAVGYGYLELLTIHRIQTISNLTRLDIVCHDGSGNLVAGIGINSRFRLWRMK